jgi:uncharacterized protein YegL
MSNEVRVIIDQQPVPRGLLAPASPAGPNIAVVYSTGFGEVACFDGKPLRRSKQVMSKFRFRYDVDLSAHRRTARLEQTPLYSRDQYRFEAEIDVSFRVTNPEMVVRCNVVDALPLVYGYLKGHPLREIAREFDIRSAYDAETEINRLLGNPVDLYEGISIFNCRIRLEPDAAARIHLQNFTRVDRTGALDRAKHGNTLADAHRSHELEDVALRGEQALDRVRAGALPGQRALEIEDAKHRAALDAIGQQSQLDAQKRQQEMLSSLPQDLWSLLMRHLQVHPDETQYVTELYARHQEAIAQRRDDNGQRSLELMRFMIDRDLIQAVDIEQLRSTTLGRVQELTSSVREELPAVSGWNDPLPGREAQVILGTAEPAPQAAESSATECVVPVYLLVDESVPAPGYVAALNAGLGGLPAMLAQHPEESSVVRLALLGYADDVVVRIPMTSIGQGSFVPAVEARSGCRLAPALRDLRGRITTDIERFKSRGVEVNRPMVIVLSASAPVDAAAWLEEHAQLTDRATFRYAPNIVACGVGRADGELVTRLATQPNQAFVAAGSDDLEVSARNFTAFAARFITFWGGVSTSGRSSAAVDHPQGFVRAAEARTSNDRQEPQQGG